MVNNNENIKKVCSFYVSDWHLVTMLLPHINEKINEKVKIATILEYNTADKMETLLEKLRIKNKEKILDIDWNKKEIDNNIIKEILKGENSPIEIIINGDMEYIEKANNLLEKYIEETNEVQNKKITIINCYNVNEYKDSIKQILDKHQKVLNTSGEKEKDEYITSINIVN
ncbi:MAG: hypothetical protein ACI4VQ_02630 [Clostridia bacterium]